MPPEYLVSHGRGGGFGRFALVEPLVLRRGEAVIVLSQRGLELGTVLCAATEQHHRLLGQTPVGQLVRRATAADRQAAHDADYQGRTIAAAARRVVAQQQLPFEILDVEFFLDGRQVILHYLGSNRADPVLLVETLANQFNVDIRLENWGGVAEEKGGCCSSGCGQSSGGGCGTCGSGGGCSSCGKGQRKPGDEALPRHALPRSSASPRVLAGEAEPRGKVFPGRAWEPEEAGQRIALALSQ